VRLRVGQLWVDVLTHTEALAEVAALVARGRGGAVFTPNVDHVVLAERDARFRGAYERASLTLADGAPIVWASKLLGTPLPAKLSGSDLVIPIAQLAASRGWRVHLVGARPGAAQECATRLRALCGVNIVGVDDPWIDLANPDADAPLLARIRASRADLVFVALGAPKQEIFCDRIRRDVEPAVIMGVGAGIDFIAGYVRRAPAWVSNAGFEWLYRLAREPRRLWRRYLVQDLAFLGILVREVRRSAADRRRKTLRFASAPSGTLSPGTASGSCP
jgi:N-acetylglucosaminyldiphosphoundecaprenol N-acetyl-beta-D-mannosaminyltransferase